ncbi:MAG TPA: GNAT family N-acetyltransferase [Actinocrinis sp.]|nr:GNAT family N-acetyltransferase [Actinocrinis sp.]
MRILLETDRLHLRRFTADDVDNLVFLDSDPQVMRFLTNGRPTPRATVQNEVLPAILRDYERGPLGRWAAAERATGEFVGWLSLQPREGGGAREAEFGYRLRRASWGRGYATEAGRALIRKGFTDLGVQRVTAETMAVNLASRRVMEKCGLTYVRTFHLQWEDPIAGAEHGEVEYELRREDWLRNNQAEHEHE